MALGAESSDVLKMVVTDGMKLAVIGLLLGIVGAALLSRYLESELYGIKATDPYTYAGVALGLGAVAAAACYFPARRATKVDPISALRHD
jgi:ABC-type antimicrobial peptide transport system permease subunit